VARRTGPPYVQRVIGGAELRENVRVLDNARQAYARSPTASPATKVPTKKLHRGARGGRVRCATRARRCVRVPRTHKEEAPAVGSASCIRRLVGAGRGSRAERGGRAQQGLDTLFGAEEEFRLHVDHVAHADRAGETVSSNSLGDGFASSRAEGRPRGALLHVPQPPRWPFGWPAS